MKIFIVAQARAKMPGEGSPLRAVHWSRHKWPGGLVKCPLTWWFRGGLVFKAHRLSYHPTQGSRVTEKKRVTWDAEEQQPVQPSRVMFLH